MVFAYMVVYTVDAPLENRKITLNRICADKDIALFASIDLPFVANRAMTAEFLFQSMIAAKIIRHNVRIRCHVLADYLLERLASHHLRVERANIAAALDQRHNRGFVGLFALTSTL